MTVEFAPFEFTQMGAVDSLWTVGDLNRAGLTAVPSLVLYVRQQSVELWEELNKRLEPDKRTKERTCRNLQITGPPGVGKSTELFGWTMLQASAPSRPVVAWFHALPDGTVSYVVAENLVWRHGSTSVDFLKSNILPSLEHADIVVLDAFRADMLTLFFLSITSMRVKEGVSRLVIACTSYGRSYCNSGAFAYYRIEKSFVLTSWELGQYSAAMMRGIKFTDVNDVEGKLDAKVAEELLQKKFWYAGMSIRLMQMQEEVLIDYLNMALARVEDKRVLLKGLQGHSTASFVHSLMAIRSKESSSCVVSEYALRELSKSVDFSFVQEAAAVMKDNPSWQGWVFELRVLTHFRRCKVAQVSMVTVDSGVEQLSLTVQGLVEYADDETLAARRDTVYIPNKWCNRAFDLVHLTCDSEESTWEVTFLNATIAARHDFNLSYVANWLQRLFPLPAAGKKRARSNKIRVRFLVLVPSQNHACTISSDQFEMIKNFDPSFAAPSLAFISNVDQSTAH